MPDSPKISYSRILLIAGVLLVLGGLSLFVDAEITRNRRSDFVSGDFRRIIQLSEIFAHGFGIAIILYLLWIVTPEKRPWIPRLAACAILPGLTVQFVKLFVARLRPGHYFPEFTDRAAETWLGVMPAGKLNFEYISQSFPSAHAATAVGLAVGLIWLMPSCRHLFVVLAFLSAFQRVVAGAHWMSDVFFGAAVSVLVCGFIFKNRRLDEWFSRLERRSSINSVVMQPKQNNTEPAESASRAA